MEQVTSAFSGTAEQEKQLHELIAAYKDVQGGLMHVLHGAQDIYGYLPEEVQKMIAEGLNLSLSHVYGVVTFYSQFYLEPKGTYKVNVCLGTACYVKGADKVLEEVENQLGIKSGECQADGLFSLDATRCVGACGLAPVVQVNEDVYGKVNPRKVAKILQTYQKKKG
ncbi:NADH-quinone oxidoreductase subunit NuoE [Vagococcus acidifermentans]|uniref:NADH-quinone oxidoreductase subunit E n=1 Tax=Vagococcus acidifermentans TaxID=564710 RepID=A0A430AQ65_9ENTE|nr:NADH-quinone oxidoreductase subunit NuoE [Vagococcus acidifermentans]RSU10259.1 NADH-quinone oxidoreductase subunit E [Vagococcus acidifermentans]